VSREDAAQRQRAFLHALVEDDGLHDGVAAERLTALRETLQRKATRRAAHAYAHPARTGWLRRWVEGLRRRLSSRSRPA
jgi:hypothetical protein